MIERALREDGLERGQLEVLVIGRGPGSYTGIRVALAVAQGWQLAAPGRGVKLVGISSVEAVAAQAQVEGMRGRVNVVVDAQRNELYLAAYEISDDSWKEVAPLSILPLEDIKLRVDARDGLVGPEVTRWFSEGRTIYPRAAMLGQLALDRHDFMAEDRLEPIYLREIEFVKTALRRPTMP